MAFLFPDGEVWIKTRLGVVYYQWRVLVLAGSSFCRVKLRFSTGVEKEQHIFIPWGSPGRQLVPLHAKT